MRAAQTKTTAYAIVERWSRFIAGVLGKSDVVPSSGDELVDLCPSPGLRSVEKVLQLANLTPVCAASVVLGLVVDVEQHPPDVGQVVRITEAIVRGIVNE